MEILQRHPFCIPLLCEGRGFNLLGVLQEDALVDRQEEICVGKADACVTDYVLLWQLQLEHDRALYSHVA